MVGGGLIGCAVARAAAHDGHRVTLVEARRTGWGASRAAAGMLAPLGEAGARGPFLDLGRASLALYPAFVSALREESGIDPGYLPSGRIHLGWTAGDEAHLSRELEWLTPLDGGARLLGPAELRERLPAVAPSVRIGLWVPGDHQVDNRQLVRAASLAARRAGVRIEEGIAVREIGTRGGSVSEVVLADGRRFPAEQVVLAAGAWSASVEGVPGPLPVVPVRGQMAALGPLPGLGTAVVEGAGVYVVPRRNGRVLVGASVEAVGFRESVTPDVVAALVRSARRLLPALGSVPVTEVWAGLRPGTPDDLPLLGPDPDLPGLVHASGHYRNGILLAPVTARIVVDLLAGRTPDPDPAPFAPERFRTGVALRSADAVPPPHVRPGPPGPGSRSTA